MKGGGQRAYTDLGAIIAAAFPAETIYYYREPPTPDAVLTLYTTGGVGPAQTFSGPTFDQRTVQVRVRAATAQACETRTEALYAYFKQLRVIAPFASIVAYTPPFYGYAQDQTAGRSIGSFNIRVAYG